MNVEIFNLSMSYPSGKTALREINLNLSSPNLIGLLGPNGAGKSTLMKLLVAGLLPTEGTISVDGKPLMKQERLLKARLGYLPQSFGLFDELTVWQFLDYMAALKGIVNSKHDTVMIVLCTSIMMLHEIHLQGSTSAGVFFQWHSQQNYLLCPVAKNFIRSLLTKLTQSSILYAEHIFEYNN